MLQLIVAGKLLAVRSGSSICLNGKTAAFEKAIRLGKINWTFEPSYNVAPTQQVPVVRFEEGENVGKVMRWGLIPFFAKGEPPKYSSADRDRRDGRLLSRAVEARATLYPTRCWDSTSGIWMTPAAKPPTLFNSTTRTSSPLPGCGIGRSSQTARPSRAWRTSQCPETTSCEKFTTRATIRTACPP